MFVLCGEHKPLPQQQMRVKFRSIQTYSLVKQRLLSIRTVYTASSHLMRLKFVLIFLKPRLQYGCNLQKCGILFLSFYFWGLCRRGRSDSPTHPPNGYATPSRTLPPPPKAMPECLPDLCVPRPTPDLFGPASKVPQTTGRGRTPSDNFHLRATPAKFHSWNETMSFYS